MNRKVLIFTYYWPPAGGVAVQRFLKFSKFLPEFGWDPVIITVDNGSYSYYDESLLNEVSPSLKVYRTKTFEPFELYNLLRGKKGKSLPLVSVGSPGGKSFFQKITEYIRANFFIPDARKGWVPYAVKQAEDILKAEKIDAIITTGPPHSTHLIGLQLKEKFGIKWIADFRDPWIGIYYNDMLPRTEATKLKDKELETSVLRNADEVVVISPGLKKEFESRAKKTTVIFNGYDDEDFLNPEPKNLKQEMFIIRYVGNLLASEKAEQLWKVIAQLVNTEQRIRIELIGRADETVKRSIDQNGLSQYVIYHPFVDHQRAIQLMQDASILLFIIPEVKGNELILTGKLFEYFASGTEMLSIGPVNGDAATILQQTGRKKMIDYRDEAEIKQQLEAAISTWRQTGAAFKYTDNKHSLFSRKNQANALAAELGSITG